MANSELISLGDFAKLSKTTRDILHNYDKIGIFTPAIRKNGNRYYSSGQLSEINMIRTLQKLGMSLADIKSFVDNRTPENIDDMLLQQIEKINHTMHEWSCAQKLMFAYRNSIKSALSVDIETIELQQLPSAPIILGDEIVYSTEENDFSALRNFYHTMQNKYPRLDLNYPVWAIFAKKRIKSGDWKWPDRYYFYNPDGHDERPAAQYAIGYTRGAYGQTDELYKRLMNYIDANDLEVCGDAAGEYGGVVIIPTI